MALKVTFVTSWLSSAGGGVSAVVEALSRSVAATGVDVTVLGLEDAVWLREHENWRGAHAAAFPVLGPKGLGIAPTLRHALTSLSPDVVHVHGIWTHVSADVVAWSRGRKPYLVSPHGMLDSWALANSGFKKRIARLLYEDRHLHGAATIHALCAAEADAIRDFGLRNPICLIPNGVDLPVPMPLSAVPRNGKKEGKRVLLFLGRLHPKKNLHGLLRALAGARRSGRLQGWRVVIAGWGPSEYAAELTALVRELELEEDVQFLGPVHGGHKDAVLRNASAFVLPSVSEGLPMAVLEAWAYGLPVAMTAACNLPEGFRSGAAQEIAEEADAMVAGLLGFLALSNDELAAMGAKGLALVRDRFSWEVAAGNFAAAYRSLLEGGAPPNAVRVDPPTPPARSGVRRALG